MPLQPANALECGVDLVNWYRTCSEHPATSDELRRMLEEYRRGRRRAARVSQLDVTQQVTVPIGSRKLREHAKPHSSR